MLPFTQEEFISLFAAYNEFFWPVQIVAYLIGAGAAAMLFVRRSEANRLIALCLSAMWLWTGIFYHWMFFAAINKAAYLFGAFFVTQGASIFLYGVVQGRLTFVVRRDLSSTIGLTMMAYAGLIYPLIGSWAGHPYPQQPMFGITPCPVTIFTFGMLIIARPLFSLWILVIPFAWSLIGGSAAFLLAIPQDWLLLFAGFVAFSVILMRGPQKPLVHGSE